ncbi:MAG: dienelactone hydrolase family protein [Chloroflexota bacterium]
MTQHSDPHGSMPHQTAGLPLASAQAAMILVHGRGATAVSILDLGQALPHPEMTYVAPQASQNTWYPYSFLAPISQNEPGISSGLAKVGALFEMVQDAGIPAEKIILGGFSQGACLASEFLARNPQRLGGLLVFSGGVIGPLGMARNDAGNLEGTPVFIGCSDVDFHIPVERVEETAVVFQKLGANVNKVIYPGMGHTIIQDEIDQAMKIVAGV